ncbi:MAG: hypothetical protein EBX52_02140 [Proteobacteria bacterium]|nr:hypothetical protein [Pseudomonadota bacterium]
MNGMKMKQNHINAIFLLTLTVVPACTNISDHAGTLSTTGNPAWVGTNTTTGSAGIYSHVLKNVTVNQAANQNGAAGNYTLSLSVDAGQSGFLPLTQFCGLGTAGNSCQCELKWTQTTQDGSSSFDRVRKLPVASVQSGLVTCAMPAADWGEIATGTEIAMNIIPGSGNMSGLHVQGRGYKKGTSTSVNGDFFDNTLTPFRNILRYSCHTKRTNSHEILNKYTTATDPNGNTKNTIISSCFCTGGTQAGGGGGGDACSSASCPNNIRSGFSAHNYYRNLYIRSDLMGDINSTNATYDCPKVLESVKVTAKSDSGTGATTVATSEQGHYWPLDSTFALAAEPSSDWSVGVRAAALLMKTGDATQTPESCQNGGPGFIENGVVPKCLGYARRPKADGSCGSITDSNGRIRPLVRLRRYRAVLPPRFDQNGKPEGSANANGGGGNQNQIYPAVDEVYVADRPVLDSNGNPTGEMIYGPKPCNYSWFDHEGVVERKASTVGGGCPTGSPPSAPYTSATGSNDFGSNLNTASLLALPQYVSTAKFYKWGTVGMPWNESLSVNPDGLVFPNRDYNGMGIGSLDQAVCSASIPEVKYLSGDPIAIELFTSNRRRSNSDVINLSGKVVYKNEIHLRPIDPWVPKYLEDTSFQACAPISDSYAEPPLHFFKDANQNMAWCAEAYPNQNPYWSALNKRRKLTSVSTSYDDILVNYKVASPNSCQIANVKGYTLHQDTIGTALGLANRCTGTTGRQICTMTDPSALAGCTNYLTFNDPHKRTGISDTCDRTVMFDPTQDYRDFPLLASDADIDDMLKNDLNTSKTFSCAYSVTPDRNKLNKTYPSTGCCGKLQGQTVLGSILSVSGAQGGHLEPLVDPIAPDVRYCGSPVR